MYTEENIRNYVENSENLQFDPRGNIIWVFEYNLFKNAGILITVLKIFFFIILGISIFVGFISSGFFEYFSEGFYTSLQVFGIMSAIMLILILIGYPILALMKGGKYVVLFVMNEDGIEHIEIQQEKDKTKVINEFALAVSLLTGNASIAGTQFAALINTSLYSKFKSVNNIVVSKKQKTIFVNSTFAKNQIYVEKEDFDFVEGFIIGHCEKAEVKK